jgi:hypothetical protein
MSTVGGTSIYLGKFLKNSKTIENDVNYTIFNLKALA